MLYCSYLHFYDGFGIFLNSGLLPPTDSPKIPEGLSARILGALMAFFATVFMLLHSFAFRTIKKLPNASSVPHQADASDTIPKEEFRPPSPTPSFTETELLSTVLKRLGELEERVNTLQEKPSEMPYEKEELLNAAVCRVDALEAELIATKKVNCLCIWPSHLNCDIKGSPLCSSKLLNNLYYAFTTLWLITFSFVLLKYLLSIIESYI